MTSTPNTNQCFDCWECPILGPCYRSSKQQDLVVCQLCLQENHEEQVDEFERCPSANSKPALGHAVANSFQALVELLQSDNCNIGEIDLYLTTYHSTPAPNLSQLRQALRQNRSLKSLQTFVRGTANLGVSVHALAEALQHSPSVVLVRFSICASKPQGINDGVAPAAAKAMQTLLQTNPRLCYFYFRTVSRYSLHGEVGTTGRDLVADHLFDGLARSSLCRFIYEGHSPVSDRNKQKALRAIQTVPRLCHIEAPFESEDCQLKIFMGDKNHGWTKRWTADKVTQSECMDVLEEIIQAQFEDKASAFYQFFRTQPRLIADG